MNFLYRNLKHFGRALSHKASRSNVTVSLQVESVTGTEFNLAQPLSSLTCHSKDTSVNDIWGMPLIGKLRLISVSAN